MTVNGRPGTVVVDTTLSPHARLKPVAVSDVKLEDDFWAPRMKRNSEVTLPSQHRQLEDTGRIDNLRIASGRKEGKFEGIYFNDSDVYKWVEAASWDIASGGRPFQDLDSVVGEIAAAQQPDGYLNSYYMFERAKDRWTNLRDMHELYCAGHMIQGAIAHHRATGNDVFLEVARRKADLIDGVFGPPESGKRDGAPGHEEIEMALVELYRDTGERRYLDLAKFFVDARGHGAAGGSAYHQDHKPLREQDEVVGHAVRAMYLYAGATDVFMETGDPSLRESLERLWQNMTTRRQYVTGGVGSRYEGESFGKDYELPNERAYTETCAAIGSIMWSWRMLQIDGDGKYMDLIELALYNAVMPGLSLNGNEYFYQNPLEDDGKHRRQPWFGCACCPPNVARMLSSLPGYFCSVSSEGVWVHLFAQSTANLTLPDGRKVTIRQRTAYPWDRNIRIEVDGEGEFSVFVRIPAWCEGDVVISAPPGGQVKGGTYTEIRRRWRNGDAIQMTLPMPVRRIVCHPRVNENFRRVALSRGPIVYCVEAVDNPGIDVRDLVIAPDTKILTDLRTDIPGVVASLRGEAMAIPPEADWDDKLYRSMRYASAGDPGKKVEFVAVPYFAWANRTPGRMLVWLRAG